MSKAFYRKYRSKTLSEVVGQSHITDILSRSLKDGKTSHAYLFTGPRGVGKTSIARILAHEINELPYEEGVSHLDIIEIDAASNNGVEDIRSLREKVQLTPIAARKKVYIIDEVHMLSKPAFNALLKTLEEPPEHIVFILATTDADKLPDTIISRTQRFSFRTVATSEVAQHLRWIAKQEGFSADDDALEIIAVHGEGSFRDSIGLLDQLHSAAPEAGISREFIEAFLGLPPAQILEDVLAAYEAKDLAAIVGLLDTLEGTGSQPAVVAAELMRSIRSSIASKPHLLPLLDALLEVSGSSRPDIKLLTTLATAPNTDKEKPSTPVKPKVAALVVSQSAVSSPLLTEIAVEPEVRTPKTEPKTITGQMADFDWASVLTHIQSNYVALFSVLSKCSHSVSGSTLMLYTGNGFYKKKLDDARYRNCLIDTLRTLGMQDLTIETIGSAAPPKDATAASVAAIMGGGVEYEVGDMDAKA